MHKILTAYKINSDRKYTSTTKSVGSVYEPQRTEKERPLFKEELATGK